LLWVVSVLIVLAGLIHRRAVHSGVNVFEGLLIIADKLIVQMLIVQIAHRGIKEQGKTADKYNYHDNCGHIFFHWSFPPLRFI
jgi:hypothetical protein